MKKEDIQKIALTAAIGAVFTFILSKLLKDNGEN